MKFRCLLFDLDGTLVDSRADITNSVTWSSSQTSIATINSVGLATWKGFGPTTIKATQGGVSNSTSLTGIL